MGQWRDLDTRFLVGCALQARWWRDPDAMWSASSYHSRWPARSPARATGWDLLTYLPPAVELPAPTDTNVFGPDGYGRLKLGMTLEQALASGEISPVKSASGPCVQFVLRAHPDAGGFITSTDGVVIIDAGEGMRTPEGIGIGSTVEEFKAAYPDYREGDENGLIGAPAPGSDNSYTTTAKARIDILWLSGPVAPCVG